MLTATNNEAQVIALHAIAALERVLTEAENREHNPDWNYTERTRHLVYDVGTVLAEANHALEELEGRLGL